METMFRVIPVESYDTAMNMAIDYAIYQQVRDGKQLPTIRFYHMKGGGVTIGRDQNPRLVNTTACSRDGLGYARRPTGGNALLHHEDDITYSIIAPVKLFTQANEIETRRKATYTTICSWIIGALQSIGLEAELHGSNNIIANGAKVVGSAQRRDNQNVFLQHGSLFYKCAPALWERYVAIPQDKLDEIRKLRTISSMTNVTKEKLYNALFREFTNNSVVGGRIAVGHLSPEERALATKLMADPILRFEQQGKDSHVELCAVDMRPD